MVYFQEMETALLKCLSPFMYMNFIVEITYQSVLDKYNLYCS